MKTFLAILGALTLGVIAFFIALFVVGFQRVGPLLEEAHAYADESIPAIATNWSGAQLSSRAAPELAALLQGGALEQLMAAGSFQFGAMTSFSGASCALTHYELRTGVGEIAVVNCAATGEFEKADAAFTLNIIKRNGEWKILGFFVTPRQTADRPVQVAYQPQAGLEWTRMEISIAKMSLGVSAQSSERIGASVQPHAKIENIK